MTRFSIVGAGWRTEFFLRIAQALPDLFEIPRILVRNPVRAEEIERTWKVKTCDSLDTLLADKPDFVITSVSWDANPIFLCELAERKMPVLSETPPARSVEDLLALVDLIKAGANIQIAEQYAFRPEHEARINLARSGRLGEVFQAQLSVAHGYHGISLIRKLLDINYEEATISARRLTEKVAGGPDRNGRPPTEETMQESTQLVAHLDFDGKQGVFDFVGSQYRSWVRSPRFLVRGTRGEINGTEVRYLKDFQTPIVTGLTRVDTGHGGNLDGYYHRGITIGDEWFFKNPFPFARLNDDEIAIAICFQKMMERIEGGPDFYPLEEGCQDHYLSILMERSADTGQPVRSEVMPWVSKSA